MSSLPATALADPSLVGLLLGSPWAVAGAVLVALVAYYLLVLSARPRLHHADSPFNRRLVAALRTLRRVYYPTPFLFNGHLQTIAGGLVESAPLVTYKRELLSVKALKHGRFPGSIALDWVESEAPLPPEAPTAVLLHGLTGGSKERYIRQVAHALHTRNGYRVVVLHARGCGGTSLETPQAFCAAYTDDVRQGIRTIAARYPQSRLFAAGYSLGSNILVKYLGEEGESTPISAAMSLANPFDLVASSRFLHRSLLSRNLYSRRLAQNLVNLYRSWDIARLSEKMELPANVQVDPEEESKIETIRDFDVMLTARSFGYPTVDSYYHDGSSARYILGVRVPLLCLSALDDPICWSESIPYDEAKANPNVVIATTPCGGHSMDWFTGVWPVRSWSADVVCEFFRVANDMLSTPAHQAELKAQQARLEKSLPHPLPSRPLGPLTADPSARSPRSPLPPPSADTPARRTLFADSVAAPTPGHAASDWDSADDAEELALDAALEAEQQLGARLASWDSRLDQLLSAMGGGSTEETVLRLRRLGSMLAADGDQSS